MCPGVSPLAAFVCVNSMETQIEAKELKTAKQVTDWGFDILESKSDSLIIGPHMLTAQKRCVRRWAWSRSHDGSLALGA